MNAPSVWFLFNRPRAKRARMVREGQWPDDGLYGYYSLRKSGFKTTFSDVGHLPGLMKTLLNILEDALSKKGKRVGFNLTQVLRLKKELNSTDLIFATADSSGLGLLFLKSLGIINRPVIYATIGLVEGFAQKQGAAFRFYKRLLRHADKIVYYGYAEGDLLRKLFEVEESKLVFIPFGVDAEFFDDSAKRTGPPLVVGIDHLRDWTLLFEVAGSLDFEIELVCNPDMIAALSVPRNIRVLPPMSMPELKNKITAAKFMILPVVQNSYTGATITLLQSMASGCATIVSKTGAIEKGYELIDGENCLMVQPGDAGDLQKAANRIYGDSNLCERLGKAAKNTVRNHHNIQVFCDRLSTVFKEVLRR